MESRSELWEELHVPAHVRQAVFDDSALAQWLIRFEDAQFLDVNDAAVQRYGYKRETFLGTDLRLLRPNDAIAVLAADYTLFAESPNVSHLRRHRQSDGTWLNVELRVHKLTPKVGLAQVLDVTSAREASEARERLQAQLLSILDGAPDAVVMIDSDGNVCEWSGRSHQVFGISRDEAMGQPMHELIMPQRFHDKHLKGLQRYVVTGQSRILGQDLRLSARRQDGTEFPILIRITRVPGVPVSFTAYIRDLTVAELAAPEPQVR